MTFIQLIIQSKDFMLKQPEFKSSEVVWKKKKQ